MNKNDVLTGNYEKITEDGVVREFYYLNGNVIVVRENGGAFVPYLAFKDNLGSFLSIYDRDGESVFEADYEAWGQQTVRLNEIGFQRGYTGHEMLNEFGLINMNGRLYDPFISRFLSPDNYVQAPLNSQSFNRYSYCLNNPLKYTDPSGESWVEYEDIVPDTDNSDDIDKDCDKNKNLLQDGEGGGGSTGAPVVLPEVVCDGTDGRVSFYYSASFWSDVSYLFGVFSSSFDLMSELSSTYYSMSYCRDGGNGVQPYIHLYETNYFGGGRSHVRTISLSSINKLAPTLSHVSIGSGIVSTVASCLEWAFTSSSDKIISARIHAVAGLVSLIPVYGPLVGNGITFYGDGIVNTSKAISKFNSQMDDYFASPNSMGQLIQFGFW